MSFVTALQEHLCAIRARDIDRFLATLSRSPELRVVAPNGSWITGFDAVAKAHREWFAGGEWSFEPQILWQRSGVDLGFALVRVTYRERDAAGSSTERRFLLSMLFADEPEGWRFLYDQNTAITERD